MSGVFLKIFNLSIAAAWLILALVLLRPLLKKGPRQLLCLLWALAALRLVLPFSLQSPLSLVPSANTVQESAQKAEAVQLDTGFTALNSAIGAAFDGAAQEPALQEPASPPDSQKPASQAAADTPSSPVTPAPVSRRAGVIRVASVIWACGAAAMAVYGLVSYLLLLRRVRASIEEGGVRFCDEVKSPFILGVFRPRIYVPSSIGAGDLGSVLAHERAHISRGDHVWKPLGFAVLCLHWFNPLVWAAYALFCRDVETACDERVIRDMEREERARYSEALMRLSSPGSAFAACPVAFGEISVKSRIKNVLSYKKPAFWVILAGAALLVTLGVLFLTDPVRSEAKCYCVLADGHEYRVNMSEEASRRLGRLVSGQRLNERGRRNGGHRIELGEKELYYDPETGTLSDRAKQRFTVVSDPIRQSINDLIGLGCVTACSNPEGNKYRIRPLICMTAGENPFIELEITTSEETDVPYYACLFRKSAGSGTGAVWNGTLSSNFGSFWAVDGSCKVRFDIDPELIAEAGTYYLCMYEDYSEEQQFIVDYYAQDSVPIVVTVPIDAAGASADGNTEVSDHYIVSPGKGGLYSRLAFTDRHIEFTVGEGHEPEASLRLYKDAETLKKERPDYAALDTKNGIDVYVYQLAPYNYNCILLPGGSDRDKMELMGYSFEPTHNLTVEDAKTLIDSYSVPAEKVRVTGWYNPISSYLYTITPSYNVMLRRLFFPEEFEAEETPAPPSAEAGTDPAAPKAHSLNANARLTVAAWDLGEGAHYAEGYSKETVKLGSAPSIAVVWENTGSGDLEFGTLLAMEYLREDRDPIRVADSTFYNLPLFVVSPGGAETHVYSLSGFNMTEHGHYRLWLDVYFTNDDIYPRMYYVDFDY